MRKSAHRVLLVVTSILASIGLCIASAFAAALAFGAVALVVPGTGTPDANAVGGYLENARDRFINPSGEDVCTGAGCLTGVNYPASFWPVPLPGWCPGLKCDTWNASVGEGVDHLLTAIDEAPVDENIVIFGYSQGGAVVSRAMYDIAPEDRSRITVVTIGNINNPQGLWSRLSFLPTIPGFNISFGPQLPTDIGVKSTNYSFEYDPVGDAPLYWGNPLAVLNALAGFVYVHGYYLDPTAKSPDDTLPYGYDPDTFPEVIANLPRRTSENGEATFVLIPQRGPLPLFMPFIEIGQETGTSQFIDPLVRLLNPVTKVLVDLGYDRTLDPSIPRNLSLLPFNPFALNPVELTVRIVNAISQGIYDASHGTPLYPPNSVSSTPDTLVATRSSSAKPPVELQPVAEKEVSDENGQPLLSDSRPEDVKQDDVKQNDLKQDDDLKQGDDLTQDEVKQGDDVTQEEVKQGDDVKQEEVKQGDDLKQGDDVKQDEVKQGDDVKQDEVKQDSDFAQNDVEQDDPKQDDAKQSDDAHVQPAQHGGAPDNEGTVTKKAEPAAA